MDDLDMLSRKDLNSAELETIRVSRNPTAVVTASEEVQTNEEAPVYVYDLDLLVTAQTPEDTPAVLSLGKLCEDYGYSYEWTSVHNFILLKTAKIQCKTAKYVPIVVPGTSTRPLPARLRVHLQHQHRRT